jgi:DnaJ-class molecular chaperone
MKNYYQILGVEQTATSDQIKQAYRRLASQHHPDKGGDKNKFQEIQEAYNVLGDNQKRSQYDQPQQGVGNMGSFDFDTIFSMFGAQFGHPQQRHRRTARMSLWITLTDIAIGGKKTISVGTEHGVQTLEIDIPKGINDGDSVQYPGLAPGGLDLVITFKIHPNPKYQRNGLNLSTEYKISVWNCILGGQIRLTDLLGNNLDLTIPPRTQPGTVFRLKSKGLQDRFGQTGDMLVQIQASIPEHISEQLIETIKQDLNQ